MGKRIQIELVTGASLLLNHSKEEFEKKMVNAWEDTGSFIEVNVVNGQQGMKLNILTILSY
jgi:hypothetical protein